MADRLDYPKDPEAFARDLLSIELQGHQIEALRAEAGTKTVLKGRQAGGSTTMIAGGLWHAFRRPRHLVLLVSASDRQATEIAERMLEVTEASPIGASLVARRADRLTFSNGSEVHVLPNSPRTIRGFGVRGLLWWRRPQRPGVTVFFDECAHAENGDQTRRAVEYALATAPPEARELWLVTTPTTSDSWVMRYFDLGQQGVEGFWSARWPSRLNKYVERAWLARQEWTALPAERKTELLGEPADEADALFAPVLPAAVAPASPWPRPPDPEMAHAVGIDLHLPYSMGTDRSGAVLLGRGERGGREVWEVADVWAARHYREADLLERLARWHEVYGVRKFLVEQFGSTGVVEGALRAGLHIETVAPTPGNQHEAFSRLYHLMDEGRLRIPAAAEELLEELRALRHTIGETGSPRFGAPGGRHDDLAFALAWAAHALRGSGRYEFVILGGPGDLPSRSADEVQAEAEEEARIASEVFRERVRAAGSWFPGD